MTDPDRPEPPRCGVDSDTRRWVCNRMTAAGLCERCAGSVGGWLAELGDLLPRLPAALVPGKSGEGQRVSGSREAPLPLNLAAVNLLGPAAGRDRRLSVEDGLDPGDERSGEMQHGPEPALSVLSGWARVVAEERDMTLPDPTPLHRMPGAPYGPETLAGYVARWQWVHEHRQPRQAEALRQFLARHHDWVTGRLWADGYAADLFDLWRTCRTLLGTWDPRPVHCQGVACASCDGMALYRLAGHDGRTCLVEHGGCGQWYSDEDFARWVGLSAHFAREAGHRVGAA